jgi:hypothetical protein
MDDIEDMVRPTPVPPQSTLHQDPAYMSRLASMKMIWDCGVEPTLPV